MFKNKFDKDPKYFTTSFYTVMVVLISAIIVKILFNWESFSSGLSSIVSLLAPFLIGIFFSYLFYPIVMFFRNIVFTKLLKIKSEPISMVFSILFTYIIVLGTVTIVLIFVIPQVVVSITDVITKAQDNYQKIPEYLAYLEEMYPSFNFTYLTDIIYSYVPSALDSVTDFITNVMPVILSTSVSVLKWIFNIFIAIVVSIYFIVDKERLARGFKRLNFAIFPVERASTVWTTGKECNTIFGNFLYGKIIDSIIIGICCFILMHIFSLPFTLLISIIVGVTNLIPYFGPFIGAIPSALIILMYGWKEALLFLLLILILQQLDCWLIGPKILGDSTGLRPVWIIFAIIVGGFVAGPVGMFLGVPVVAVIAHLVNKKTNSVLTKKGFSDMITEEEEEEIIKYNIFNILKRKKR